MRGTTLQLALRAMAVIVLLLGAAGLAAEAMDFAADKQHDFRDWLSLLFSQNRWLSLSLFGGMLYVVPGIRLPAINRIIVDGRGLFSFQATFGPYIKYESLGRLILRWSLGAVCLLLGIMSGMLSQDLSRRAHMYGSFGYVMMWLTGIVSPFLILVSWRFFARRAESVLRRNSQRPVLYLRSFGSDVSIFSGMNDLFRLLFLLGLKETPEVALRKALANIGPLVAVGRPGESLPTLGAARLYVRDEWQRVVATLAAESKLVIFRIGRTQGFWWEVQHAVKACDPMKVFIYLPREDRGRIYRKFRKRAADFFPQPLPERVGRATFLTFDANWNPRLLGINGPSADAFFRWFVIGKAPGVREALNEGLRPLGLDYFPLPWSWREWLGLIVCIIVLCQCLFGILVALLTTAKH